MMLCPLCQETLQLTDRQGIEIDYCPKCRGVWLDRGELQKLIDLSVSPGRQQTTHSTYARHERPDVDDAWERKRPESGRYPDQKSEEFYGYGKQKKRESWFSELFDFD